MKAIRFSNGRTHFTQDAPLPVLTPHFNVLVRVHYAGICRTDIGIAHGAIAHREGIVLGHEFCGTIERLYGGEQTSGGWSVGMAVSCNPMMFGENDYDDIMCGKDCDGAFAEYIRVPGKALVGIPSHLLNPLGAYTEPVAAALAPLRFLENCWESDVCVFGNNRIAELTMQVAHSMGHKYVRRLTNVSELRPCSYDCIIETEPQHLCEYIDALRPGGKLIMKSRAFSQMSIIPNAVAMKEITIQGARYGEFGAATHLLAAANWNVAGVLDCEKLLGATYDLSDYEAAFAQAKLPDSKKIFFKVCAE